MNVRFKVLTAIPLNNTVFCDIKPYNVTGFYRRFRGTSVNFYGTACRHIPEDGYLKNTLI
jgi:hypothetical protein